jgi:hypothetical protein
MTQDNPLYAKCNLLSAQASATLDWLSTPDTQDIVGANRRSIEQITRRSLRRARKLGRAAVSRMSVSVFGPSQAGKSFLVSVLARPRNGRLVAAYAGSGGELDYIREINPEGEGESTGLVTRFTMQREPSPDGFPIPVNLLSAADVARVLINSFYMDGDQSEPVPERDELTAHLDRFRGRMGPVPVPGLDADDLYEIGEYVERNFGRNAYATAFKGFWDEAGLIASRLVPADRAEFLGVLWGHHKPLNALYLSLISALAKLEHVEKLHVGLDALTPRETSIIDVKTLRDLASAQPTTPDLPVFLPNGSKVNIRRGMLCALAAELVLPMRDLPHDIFSETDLLDFPGARNRFEQPIEKTLENSEIAVPELLLRGKVAYLFDRYVENQDITSMLLCVPDSNMETMDLPGLVSTWVASTHGSTPEQRRLSDCILFFVLTKFDKHLGDSASQGGAATRFERRLQASLLEKFTRGRDNWAENWRPGEAFRNCFWLRNPNYFVDGLIDYDDDRNEIRIRPDKENRLAELKAGCVSSPLVARHFSDPEAAWDAALALNDGGVGYLVSALTPVCKSDSKKRQIEVQLGKVAGDLRQMLQPYFISDDIGQRIEERLAAAGRVIDDLEIVLSRHRFGALLSMLMVDQELIADRIARVPSSVRIFSAVSSSGAARSMAGGDSGTPGLLRPIRKQNSVSPQPSPVVPTFGDGNIRTMTLEDFQAQMAIEVWIEQLKSFQADEATQAAYGICNSSVIDLVAELIGGAQRQRLAKVIAADLAEISFGLTVDRQAHPAAMLCAERINDYVHRLGTNLMAEKDRPSIQLPEGQKRPLFRPHAASDLCDDLPAQPRRVAEELWTDWVFALEDLFRRNAADAEGGTVNIENNRRLGEILARLTIGQD